jgi:hypothetical protein
VFTQSRQVARQRSGKAMNIVWIQGEAGIRVNKMLPRNRKVIRFVGGVCHFYVCERDELHERNEKVFDEL